MVSPGEIAFEDVRRRSPPASAAYLSWLLESVELRNFPVPVTLRASGASGRARLVVELSVRDRDTGARMTASIDGECDVERFPECERPRVLVEFVRRLLVRAMEHEVDEALHVGGVRVFDPHRGEAIR